MKKIIIAMILLIGTSASTQAGRYWHRHMNITVQTFYDELSPYGDWIYTPDYGYVWRPYFDYPENFRPYSSRGNWVNTEYGWTWVSDYPWGWATFHYGRWYFDDYMGWMWIPGYEWAPAWVTWGAYDNYWGWAPLGPNINVSINFNWFAPDPWWTFVPRRHFCSNDWYSYIYDRPVIVRNITHITNIYNYNDNSRRDNWFYGPRVNEVERYSHGRVRQVKVVDNDRPENPRVNNGQLRVYRPQVNPQRDNSRPAQVRNYENERGNGTIIRQNARSNDPGNYRSREAAGSGRERNSVTDDKGQRDSGMQRTRETPDRNNSRPDYNNNKRNDNSTPGNSRNQMKPDAPSNRESTETRSRNEDRSRQNQVDNSRQNNRGSSESSRIKKQTDKNGDRMNREKESRKNDRSSERSNGGNNRRK